MSLSKEDRMKIKEELLYDDEEIINEIFFNNNTDNKNVIYLKDYLKRKESD